MTSIKKLLFSLFAAFAVLMTPMAHAGDPIIDGAKDKGLVGENISGYLETIGAAEPALQRKVDEINAKRRDVYTQLANQQGQSLSTIARLSGEKLVAGEEAGRFVFDDSGRWVKK